MYREETIEAIKACRFCFMCRHVCTIGNVTRTESNTPRGFGLLADKSVMDASRMRHHDFIAAMYECTLCCACRSHCVSSYDVPGFVRAARAEIVAAGNAPVLVAETAKRIIDSGNPFGESGARFGKIPSVSKKTARADVLLFIGSYAAYRTPEVAEAAIKILTAAKIPFTVIADEIDSGKSLLNLGYADDAKAAAKNVIQSIRDSGAKTVVTLCPGDYDTMKNDYPAFGLSLGDVTVIPAALFYRDLIKSKKLSVKQKLVEAPIHIDSDYLRKYNEHDDDTRELLTLLGAPSITEVGTNREESYAALEGGVVYQLVQPETGKRVIERAAAKITAVKGGLVAVASPVSKVTLTPALHGKQVKTFDEIVAAVL